ncbi:MAG: TRAP transporter substrate-binding protein DctP [Deltaproteobacteria bacterium]|nr:TRAP transporter substrate-binding protein DctP [Deltaproteobacteria bacterium]
MIEKKSKFWACLLVTGLFVLALTGITPLSHSADQPIKLVFSDFEMAGSYWDVEFVKPWFAELKKRTNGKVEIEEHWNGELVGLFDAYDSILKGVIDMGHILTTMNFDKFPLDSLLIFNAVNINCHRPSQVWYDLYKKFPKFREPYKDTPLLAFAATPCNGLCTTAKVEIKSLTDCKGLKMPGPGPAPEARLKAVGIVPVSIPPSDTYMAFKTGTLDGLALTLFSLRDFKWGDVLKNTTLVSINGSPWSYVMSKKAWNRLPPELQKIFEEMVPWTVEHSDRAYNLASRKAMETLPKEFGTKFIELSQEELDKWAELDSKTLDDYIGQINKLGLPGDEVKTTFIQLQKKYAAPEYAF